MLFQVLIPHVASVRQKQGLEGKWAVLFIDGHATHTQIEVVRLCQEHQIDLITLFPHSSHLTQPLDLTIFKSWRDSLRKVCTDFVLFNQLSEI